jgi:DNA-binding transcriptional MerR regulator
MMVAPGAAWMPIGELSRRVGVSTDRLRKWERRYGVLAPGRTNGNQRLYSRLDEARLRVMVRHVQAGMPAAQAAELAVAARFRVAAPVGADVLSGHEEEARRRLVRALERYDETGADREVEKLAAGAAPSLVVHKVFFPLIAEIHEACEAGQLTAASAHFAAGYAHSRLLGLTRGWDRGLGPRAVLACAPGEQHTLGLIGLGIALREMGWRVTYLGANTDLGALAAAMETVSPRITVIGAARSEPLTAVEAKLARLDARGPVAVAGPGATRATAAGCGVRRLDGDVLAVAAALAG